MKRHTTFLNGITLGVANIKDIFIPGPCFLTGRNTNKLTVSPPVIEYIRTSFYHCRERCKPLGRFLKKSRSIFTWASSRLT
jgi:hypothetical protein